MIKKTNWLIADTENPDAPRSSPKQGFAQDPVHRAKTAGETEAPGSETLTHLPFLLSTDIY
jgi:hypothetical protein